MYLTGIRGHGSRVDSYRIAWKCVLIFPDIVYMNALCLKGTSYEKQKKRFLTTFSNTVYEDYVFTQISYKSTYSVIAEVEFMFNRFSSIC